MEWVRILSEALPPEGEATVASSIGVFSRFFSESRGSEVRKSSLEEAAFLCR